MGLWVADFTLKNGILAGGSISGKLLGVAGNCLTGSTSACTLDLKGRSCVYPGLINTHDHLQGNYRPAVGPKPGTFYPTWLPWDNDLKASATFKERSNLNREDLYNFSGYKCLFSGVTTVNDHFPRHLNAALLPRLPIRAITEYALAHEATSYDLKWGDGVEVEHAMAIEKNWPFITHLAEGFDDEAMDGVNTLERLKVLDDHCLLIHCIGFSDEDIEKVSKAGASVSWCGFSNMFMFNVTCKIRKMIQAGVDVTIGTDSSATGSANLLEEMRYDRNLYRKMYGEELPAQTMFRMVTSNAARAFRMGDRIGSLDEGKLADILVTKARKDNPYENLLETTMEDIELLVLEGNPIYGELRFLDIFRGKLPEDYTKIIVGERPMFVKGDPTELYMTARKKIGIKKVLDFLPFEPDGEKDGV
jgi:cytosine/adenosine deaminase-related metal-dependent hydrolase